MTPWKRSIFVLFILGWIDVSEERCHDYFRNVEDWNQSLIDPVGYVNLPDKNDSIRCTLQINIPIYDKFDFYLQDCYEPEGKNTLNITMCHGHTTQNISYYHFMCWIASALNLQCIGCYPGDLCLGPSSATRTIPPTPTTPPPPTTMPERTSTAPTPTPTTPPTTTTVPERTSTAPPPTPTTPTVNTVNRSSADHPGNPDKLHGIDKPTVSLLSISVMVNVVLLLLVIYLWMHRRRKELIVEILNEPTSPQSGLTTEEPNSTIPLQNHELSYLIHENENEKVCNSTDTHSLLNGNDCAVNKILP